MRQIERAVGSGISDDQLTDTTTGQSVVVPAAQQIALPVCPAGSHQNGGMFVRQFRISQPESEVLVDGLSVVTNSVMTWMRPLRVRSDRALRRAAAFIFLGVRWV